MKPSINLTRDYDSNDPSPYIRPSDLTPREHEMYDRADENKRQLLIAAQQDAIRAENRAAYDAAPPAVKLGRAITRIRAALNEARTDIFEGLGDEIRTALRRRGKPRS